MEAFEVAKRTGNPFVALTNEHNIACTLRMLGRNREAYEMMRPLIPTALAMSVTGNLMSCAEDFGALLAELGEIELAAMLLGAADARHDEVGQRRLPQQDLEIADAFERARAASRAADWDEAYRQGRATPIREALLRALDATPESWPAEG
jgi:hypothetical protein